MAFTALTVPSNYGYVLLAATSSCFLNSYYTFVVRRARKKAGVEYPNASISGDVSEKDTDAFRLACAQHAHNDLTANMTPFLGALCISGLRYPLLAAGLGGVWTLPRVAYVIGYTSSGGPRGRIGGSASAMLMDISLKLLALYTSAMTILGR